MAHPYHHGLSSVRKWGGSPFDYLPLHSWFDQSKAIAADFRHRALHHHAEVDNLRTASRHFHNRTASTKRATGRGSNPKRKRPWWGRHSLCSISPGIEAACSSAIVRQIGQA
jgi:hypothetical protein